MSASLGSGDDPRDWVVQVSTGDKDRASFPLAGSLTQARSRDSILEHEHCVPHMWMELAAVKWGRTLWISLVQLKLKYKIRRLFDDQ